MPDAPDNPAGAGRGALGLAQEMERVIGIEPT
jgi:hypothetical protein